MRPSRVTLLLGCVTATTALVACSAGPTPPPFAAGTNGVIAGLASYDSCEDLLAYFVEHGLEEVTAYGFDSGFVTFSSGDGTAADESAPVSSTATDTSGGADAGGGFSGTNNQVDGVDEADLVKTNGDLIVSALSQEQITVVDTGAAQVVATIPGLSGEMLMADSTLIVLGQEGDSGAARTTLTEVDLSVPSDPVVGATTTIEGSYRSARLIDGTVRLAMVSEPLGLDLTFPEDGSLASERDALEANREAIRTSAIEDWLPDMSTSDGDIEPLLDCDAVGIPEEFSGFWTTSVITLDLGAGTAPTSAAGVLSDGSTVYASTDRMIVATTPWSLWANPGSGGVTTDLHTFDISDPGATTYAASGRVDGWLLNQFSLDESGGIVRVATTTEPTATEASQSAVVVMREEGGALVETGRVDELGLTERIYSVRYLSPDLAAVVTFREIDPLYLIDTSDPANPRMTGELKIPGYSAYLHPISDDLLLGIGQDATDGGITTGLQASLFDISDLSNPERVAVRTWEGNVSPVEWDHRAFLQWQDRIYLPAEGWGGGMSQDVRQEYSASVLSLDIDGTELVDGPVADLSAATSAGDGSALQRLVVVGDHLWGVGSYLVQLDLQTFEPVTVLQP